MTLAAPQRATRKPPPYSAHVPASVKTVWISAGPAAWDRAKRWRWEGEPGLVLPPDGRPQAYQWPVRGYNVALVALDMPIDEVGELVRELIAADAGVIAALFGPSHATRMELIAHGRHV